LINFLAQTIISGSIDFLGNNYRLRIRALDVQTARIQGTFSTDVKRDSRMKGLERVGNTGNIPLDDWKNNRLYLGARVGFVQGTYRNSGSLIPASASLNSVSGFDGGVFGAVSVLGNLEIQAEVLISNNSFEVTNNNSFKSVTYTSVELPLLVKLVWRPSVFMVQGYGGAAVSLPLGQIVIKHSNGTINADFDVMGCFVLGVGTGIKLGPGVLLSDIRYTGDFNALTANINGGNSKISQRNRVSFSLAYEIGLIQK
jgi:hypothetical protein